MLSHPGGAPVWAHALQYGANKRLTIESECAPRLHRRAESEFTKKFRLYSDFIGAGERFRTVDLVLGKHRQMSLEDYSRITRGYSVITKATLPREIFDASPFLPLSSGRQGTLP